MGALNLKECCTKNEGDSNMTVYEHCHMSALWDARDSDSRRDLS